MALKVYNSASSLFEEPEPYIHWLSYAPGVLPRKIDMRKIKVGHFIDGGFCLETENSFVLARLPHLHDRLEAEVICARIKNEDLEVLVEYRQRGRPPWVFNCADWMED